MITKRVSEAEDLAQVAMEAIMRLRDTPGGDWGDLARAYSEFAGGSMYDQCREVEIAVGSAEALHAIIDFVGEAFPQAEWGDCPATDDGPGDCFALTPHQNGKCCVCSAVRS